MAGQPRLARARRHCWLRPGVLHSLGSPGRGHASVCQRLAVIRWAQGLSRQDSLVQCHCKDTRVTGSLCVSAACPCRQHLWSPDPVSIGDGARTPSPAPGHSGVGTRGDGDSWPALSQARLPHWLRPSLHFKLLFCRSRLSRALGRTTPSWGPGRMGTPPGQRPVPCPDSRWWLLGPFPVEQQPQGHASGLHIWRPAVALPHLPWAAAPGAADTPAPAGPLLAGTLLNPEDRTGGAAGAPDGATLTAAGPGPWGPRPPCPAGGVGAASGGVWRGHFPAQTDGAGLEPWLPQGGGWIWYG